MKNYIETKEKEPKEILYATQNAAKLLTLKNILGHAYKIVSLKDVGIESQTEEGGVDPKENALKKARYCFQMTGRDSFSMDFGFFIEGLSKNEQPGSSVKSLVPISREREPTDEEILDFYKSLIFRLGGKVNAYWLRALAYVSKDGEYIKETKIPKILVSTPHWTRFKGFPMTSIQLDPRTGKYESEMTEEEKRESHKDEDEILKNFIKEHTS